MKVDTHLEFGQPVYFKVDPQQLEYLVSGFLIRPNGLIIYYVSGCGQEEKAYDFEISTEKRVVL
jgi:hypothetical protein